MFGQPPRSPEAELTQFYMDVAASIQDVREFHQTYYVPENATLTIVGDFDLDQTKAMVNRYFGRIAKAANPVPRDIPKEPARTQEKRVTVEENWPLPAVMVPTEFCAGYPPVALALRPLVATGSGSIQLPWRARGGGTEPGLDPGYDARGGG